MIRLLRFLITGSWHEHTWEVIDQYNTQLLDDDERPYGYVHTYVQKCTICGKLKTFKVER